MGKDKVIPQKAAYESALSYEQLITTISGLQSKIFDAKEGKNVQDGIFEAFISSLCALEEFLENQCTDPEITIPGWIEVGYFYMNKYIRISRLDDANKDNANKIYPCQRAEKAFAKAQAYLEAAAADSNLPLTTYRHILKIALLGVTSEKHIIDVYRLEYERSGLSHPYFKRPKSKLALQYKNELQADSARAKMDTYIANDMGYIAMKMELTKQIKYEEFNDFIMLWEAELKQEQASFYRPIFLRALVNYHDQCRDYLYFLHSKKSKFYPPEKIDALCGRINDCDAKDYYEQLLLAKTCYTILMRLCDLGSEARYNFFRAKKDTFEEWYKSIAAHLQKFEQAKSNAATSSAATKIISEEDRKAFYQEMVAEHERKLQFLQRKKLLKAEATSHQQASQHNKNKRPNQSATTNQKSTSDQSQPISQEDEAYRLFSSGKFAMAASCYQKLLPSDLTILDVKILSAIGDCFKTWAKFEKLSNNQSRIYNQLKLKAIQNYEKAMTLLESAKAAHSLSEEDEFRLQFLKQDSADLQKTKSSQVKEWIVEVKSCSVKNLGIPEDVKPAENKALSSQKKANIPLDDTTQFVIDRLAPQHKCYIVGGSVRDYLLGKKAISDVDVVTTALPEYIRSLLKTTPSPHTLKIVGSFPVVKFSTSEQNVDISTLRSRYNDGTNQRYTVLDNGTFVYFYVSDLFDMDVLGRDFSINGLYYDSQTQTIYDPTGHGLKDLENKLLRTIIDANESFREDPLRMLRAIRFMARGFKLEEEESHTRTAFINNKHLILGINKSRLYNEVTKLFFDGHAQIAFQVMNESEFDLLSLIFPDIATYYTAKNDSAYKYIVDMLLSKLSNRWIADNYSDEALLFAVLFWGPIEDMISQYSPSNQNEYYTAISTLMNQVIEKQLAVFNMPPDVAAKIPLIWTSYVADKYQLQTGATLPYEDCSFSKFKMMMDEYDKTQKKQAVKIAPALLSGIITQSNDINPVPWIEEPKKLGLG